MIARAAPLLALIALAGGCAQTPPAPPPAIEAPRLTAAEERRRLDELAPPRGADRARASAAMREARAALARRPEDRISAAAALRDAARLGDRDAQFMLATDEALRLPEEAGAEGALAWLTRAAVQGLPRAQFTLAEEYASGRRIRREPGWANVWYERAARQGDGEAALALARRARAGLVRGVDDAAAYFWSSIALKLGLREARRDRDEAGAALGADDRRDIDAVAAAWRPVAGGERVTGDPALTRFVQAELVANGFDAGPDDGVMGPRSTRALIAFKASQGTGRPDESLDVATILALRDAALSR